MSTSWDREWHTGVDALLRSYEIATGDQPSERRLVSRFPVDHRIVEGAISMLLFAYIAVLRNLVQLTGWDSAGITQFDSELQSFLNDGPLVAEEAESNNDPRLMGNDPARAD